MQGVIFGKKERKTPYIKITLNKVRDVNKHGERYFDIIRILHYLPTGSKNNHKKRPNISSCKYGNGQITCK